MIIRPWRPADRDYLERMTSDAEMMRFINGRPWVAQEVDELLERQQRHLDRHGICFGAAELSESGEVVGLIGMQPLASGDFEIGWWVWKEYWGRGLAVEGIRPFIQHAATIGLSHVWAIIYPENAASIRVAEKLGMQFVRYAPIGEILPGRGDDTVGLYRLEPAREAGA